MKTFQNIFIPDKKLSTLGLQKSKLFLGGRECPQIVLPILDLIGKDSKWSKYELLTMPYYLLLLSTCSDANSTLIRQLHPSFTQNVQNQDIAKGLVDYYSWSNLTFEEFTENEDLLFQILSNFLKRKIIFQPILEPIRIQQIDKTFGDNFDTVFRIFGDRNHGNSYYISATTQ